MSIDRGTARLLLEEGARHSFKGSILQLGRQRVLFNEMQLQAWANQAAVVLGSEIQMEGTREPKPKYVGEQLTDERFFRLLGFDQVASCDVSNYEGATFAVDLNRPIPSELRERFDVVFNGGTMEHIFDVRAVLANLHALLKIGGRIIHIAPTSNMIDHGFYSFSPTFFRDYYRENNYIIRTLYLFECFSWTGKWTVYDCMAGGLDNRLGRAASSRMAGSFCVAEKTAASTSEAIPAQSHFAELWANGTKRGPMLGVEFRKALTGNYPGFADIFFRIRAWAWRASAIRRAALPPVVRKY